jgi:hypothetical protein
MNFLIVDTCFCVLPHEKSCYMKPGQFVNQAANSFVLLPQLGNQYLEHADLKNEMMLDSISCIRALSSLFGNLN